MDFDIVVYESENDSRGPEITSFKVSYEEMIVLRRLCNTDSGTSYAGEVLQEALDDYAE